MSKIIPACIMEEKHSLHLIQEELQKEIARQKEAERVAHIAEVMEQISDPNVNFINQKLVEIGSCTLTLAAWDSNRRNYPNDFNINSYYAHFPIEIKGKEAYEWLKDSYIKAGYKVSIHDYSQNYYKIQSCTIWAEPKCETCEV